MRSHEWCPARLHAVAATASATIDPAPTDEERDAILAALERAAGEDDGWAAAALLEGVEDGEPDP